MQIKSSYTKYFCLAGILLRRRYTIALNPEYILWQHETELFFSTTVQLAPKQTIIPSGALSLYDPNLEINMF
jgi:hypothetical protein